MIDDHDGKPLSTCDIDIENWPKGLPEHIGEWNEQAEPLLLQRVEHKPELVT